MNSSSLFQFASAESWKHSRIAVDQQKSLVIVLQQLYSY